MRTKFCQTTHDISLMLSQKEVDGLKRNNGHIPSLTARCDELTFHLMHSTEINDYIEMKDSSNKINPHYWIRISDCAYNDLINKGKCSLKYGETSMLNISIESL